MKNKRIIEAIDVINLSESDADRIYKSVTSFSGREKRSVRAKTVVIFAAVFLLAVLAAGSVFAGKLISQMVTVRDEHAEIGLDGSKEIVVSTYEAYSEDPCIPVPYDEMWLIQHSSQTEVAIASDDDACIVYGLKGNIATEQELSIISLSENDVFLLPKYIPDNFSFSSAAYTLYLEPQEVDGAASCTDTFVKDGYIYQNYKVQGSVKNNIDSLIVTYRNETGESVVFMCELFSGNNISINASTDAKVEKKNIAGFDSAVLVSDDDHSICVAANLIEPVLYSPDNAVGMAERASEYDQPFSDNTLYYDRVLYSVSSDTVSGDELIKILSSVIG